MELVYREGIRSVVSRLIATPRRACDVSALRDRQRDSNEARNTDFMSKVRTKNVNVVGANLEQDVILSNSLLLALPLEIRSQIYEHALGGRWLHVHKEGQTVVPCLDPARFRLRHDVIKSSPTRQRLVPALASHDACFSQSAGARTSERLPLALLQTCRQVYLEARLVPFCTNTFIFQRRSFLESFFLMQGWERGLALRRVVLMHLFDNDYGLHHFMPNVKHISVFVLLYRRASHSAITRKRSYTRTFEEFHQDVPSLASARVCLEFCGAHARTEGLAWMEDWDFRTAESNIENLLTRGVPLSARTRTLLEV